MPILLEAKARDFNSLHDCLGSEQFRFNLVSSMQKQLTFELVMLQREYFKQGKLEQFRQILEEGSSPGNHTLFFLSHIRFFVLYFRLVLNLSYFVVE